MFFLMNNHVLRLDEDDEPPARIQHFFDQLSIVHITQLGAELFAKHPILPVTSPLKARRLAALIKNKAPQVNAALFVAPSLHATPEEVSVRYADVCIETMAMLQDRFNHGRLCTVEADRMVWRRLAA